MAFRRARLLLFPLLFLDLSSLRAEKPPSTDEVTHALAQMRAADPEIRLEGVRAIQTSLDPRIPDACLPLIQDPGNSVRRLVLRAIGSRYHQIPGDQIPAFSKAIKEVLAPDPADWDTMADRALRLLERDYRGDMVVASPDKRWAIYERRGRPCIIDTRSGTERLLGKGDREDFMLFLPAYSNGPVRPHVSWHPKSAGVALAVSLSRRHSAVLLWSPATDRTTMLLADLFMNELGLNPNSPLFSSSVDARGWKGDTIILQVEGFTSRPEPNSPEEGSATVVYDFVTDKHRIAGRRDRIR